VGRRVLITGISRHLAGRLAQALESDPEVESIVGVDVEEPEVDLERTEFVHADIRNPLIVKVIEDSGADTVVHLNIIATPTRVGGRSAIKEINVIGSLQLFAACQKATTLRRVVMKSTTAVYGADPHAPALFTEGLAFGSTPSRGYAKDAAEVEQYARDFGRRRPEIALTILRFANFMGSQIETPLTRYFSLPAVPTAMGFDPRIQFVHEDDAVEVLHRATREDHPGIFNVCGDGVLHLSQAIRICGKVAVPVIEPLAGTLAALLQRAGLADFPADQVRLLVYGRVADNERLKRRFGYEPVYTTRTALEEFVKGNPSHRLITPERVHRWTGSLEAALRARAAAGAGR